MKTKRDRQQHGRDAADPTLEPADRRREHERQQDRQRDRHQDGLRPVQDDDHEHAPGERDPRRQAVRRVTHGVPHADSTAGDLVGEVHNRTAAAGRRRTCADGSRVALRQSWLSAWDGIRHWSGGSHDGTASGCSNAAARSRRSDMTRVRTYRMTSASTTTTTDAPISAARKLPVASFVTPQA